MPKQLNKYLNLKIEIQQAKIARMSNSAVGAFHRLQLYAAQHGGTVPADDTTLRRISCSESKDWKRNRDQILGAMEPCESGYHIEAAAISEDQYERAVEKARAGGLAKAKASAGTHAGRRCPARNGTNPLKSLDGTLPVAGQIAKYKVLSL